MKQRGLDVVVLGGGRPQRNPRCSRFHHPALSSFFSMDEPMLVLVVAAGGQQRR
jgi:hypothetical protein